MLGRVRRRRFAHPRAILMRRDVMGKPLPVAGAVAGYDAPQLTPIAFAEVVVAALLVPAQLGIWRRQPEHLGLRRDHVDESLAQLIIRESLDAPRHRLRGVR